MTLQMDLASAFAEVEATVPVTYGASSARGFLDRAGTVRKVGGVGIQVEEDTLYLAAGAIPNILSDTPIRIGAVGAPTAEAGTLFNVARSPALMDDGMMVAIGLSGGAS